MNKTSNKEISNWKSMSNTLHPINTRTKFRWRKAGGIYVKWNNCLKREGIGKQRPVANCSLEKYIMLLGRSVEDRASSSFSWIRILSGIWKRAWNFCSDRTPIGCSDLRHPDLVFFHPLCWGLLLVEATPLLAIMLSGFGPYGNLRGSTQLLEPITQPIRHLALPQQYKKKPKRTKSPKLKGFGYRNLQSKSLSQWQKKNRSYNPNAMTMKRMNRQQTQMPWQHRNKRRNWKALKSALGTSILSQAKHPE